MLDSILADGGLLGSVTGDTGASGYIGGFGDIVGDLSGSGRPQSGVTDGLLGLPLLGDGPHPSFGLLDPVLADGGVLGDVTGNAPPLGEVTGSDGLLGDLTGRGGVLGAVSGLDGTLSDPISTGLRAYGKRRRQGRPAAALDPTQNRATFQAARFSPFSDGQNGRPHSAESCPDLERLLGSRHDFLCP